MIFGFDHDDDSVFERTVEFLQENRIELVMFNILTPLPGTDFYKRMDAEGRIIDRDWSHYDGRHVVYQPKLMSAETLQEGFFWAYHKFYSYPSMIKRIVPSFFKVPRKMLVPERLAINWAYRRIIKRIPEGSLTPLAGILNAIPGTLPSKETEGFIPNAVSTIKEKIESVSEQVSTVGNNLLIKVKKSPKVQALLIELDGTMDRINALELKGRISNAIEKTKMDIVINFENLKGTTPAAISALFDASLKDKLSASRLKCINLSASFRAALEQINSANLTFIEIQPEEVY